MKDRGFTLIELLIVVAIIGILAAIAIPQFSAYRMRGYNAAALADTKSMLMGEETYFSDTYAYLAIPMQTGPGQVGSTGIGTGILLPMVKLSNGVTTEAVVTGSSITTTFLTIGSSHVQGSRIFCFEADESIWKFREKIAGQAQVDGDVTAATSSIDFVPDGTL